MFPRDEMLEAALSHAKKGDGFVRDERGIHAFFHEGKKCMIGAFIPISVLFYFKDIEKWTTYEIRDKFEMGHEEFEFIKEMDLVNMEDEVDWVSYIQEKIEESRSWAEE